MGDNRDSAEWLDFVVDTLKHLDEGVQATFLQEFLLGLVSLDVTENEGFTHWEGVLSHQRQLVEKLGRPVPLRTAAVDYFRRVANLAEPHCDGVRRAEETAAQRGD